MSHRRALRRSFATATTLLIGTLAGVGLASAHVKYVTPGADPISVVQFLVETLSNPFNLALLGGGGTVAVAAMAGYLWVQPFQSDFDVLRESVRGYRDLIPWLLRLSIGLPLVGAGFNGYFFAPVVVPANGAVVRLFGVTLGFLLLFGFGTRLVAGVGLAAYLGGLVFEPSLVLASEYVPGFLAIMLVGGGRPSADQIVARLAANEETFYSRIDPFYRSVAVPFVERVRRFQSLLPTVLRAGMGLSFVYLGVVQKIMNPGEAVAVVVKYDLTAVVPVAPELWVLGAGLAEVAVGLALLAGLFTRGFAALSLVLFTMTLFGLPDDPVLAHVSLFGLASVLIITGGGPLSLDARLHDEYVEIKQEMLSPS